MKVKELGYIEKGTGQHQTNTFYSTDGISRTLTACDYKSPPMVLTGGGEQMDDTHIYPCLTPERKEKRQNGPRFRKDDEEMFTLTSQDRHGIAEVRGNMNNYLSQKGVDYVLDPKRGMCTDVNANVAQTLTAKGQQNWTGSFVSPDIDTIEKSNEIGSKEPNRINLKNGEQITSDQKEKLQGIRIRKLTPKECWRLMGFTDEEFERAAQVVSPSQLYKQAGNSIVVNVLSAIWSTMLDELPY